MIEIIPLPLAQMLTGAFLSFLGFLVLLNIFGLPANWLVLGLVVLWHYFAPDAAALDVLFWVLFVGLALLGEGLEMGLQVLKAKRYGSSSSGTMAGMIGAIVGAIVLAPLFFGIGALLGALAGAWLGCFIMEKAKGRPMREAADAAFGAMMGRFLGTVCKCGVGIAMVALTAHYIWPEMGLHLPLPVQPPAPLPHSAKMVLAAGVLPA
jgi:uncharacterized protein YqgC (DUF456 family)